MKRVFLCILSVLLICTLLCGCGRRDGEAAGGKIDLLPDTSPMTSPDMSDGIVNDQNGVIGDEPGGGVTVSPSPAVSSESPDSTNASSSPDPAAKR